jgi:hypothetical protein
MNINFFLEIILILIAILASNGIIYILPFFNLNKNKPSSSENISVLTNSSEKDVLGHTLLIASNPLRLTSSESSASQSVTSSETNVPQDIFDSEDLDIVEGTMTQTPNSNVSATNDGTIPSNLDVSDHVTSLDSITILNSQTLEQ